jgi:hypothetical protein
VSRIVIVTLTCGLAACAGAAIQPALVQPTPKQERDCKVHGFAFRELGILRDAGRDEPAAVAAVKDKIQGLAQSAEEKATAASILATAETTARFVYVLDTLEPTTLMYFGANVCLMQAAGDWDPDKAVALSRYAGACQKEYPPASAQDRLRACITNEAVRLVTQKTS